MQWEKVPGGRLKQNKMLSTEKQLGLTSGGMGALTVRL